ncbi:MAG TPA: UDP-N-acetylglucosamine 1-carboxyvinyltransferase, partial [Acidimicrobiaceae bacterium]|nr:UDP-N-acetylglucosamine 1-carboxyvinyltransferase [Acidimicrobiaceae bacterium]
PGDLVLETPATLTTAAPYELSERLRASVVVLGPLLARAGEAAIPLPGGDDFGSRPIDIHLNGLGSMGVEFATVHGNVEGRVPGSPPRLVGSRLVLE